MVKLLQKIFFILIMFGGLAITYYSLNNLQQIYMDFSNVFVRFGVIFIFIFTLIIIIRYVLLMLFSIIQIVSQSAEEGGDLDYTHRVSVIVPCYNEQAGIAASLTSLLEQVYPNMEVIVVDDGSKDCTYTIAKTFEFDNGRKKLRVLSKTNGGKSRALNYGIQYAEGDLVMSVDADSKLEPHAIELLVQRFRDEQIAAVAGSVKVINDNGLLTRLQALEYIEGLNMVKNGQAFLKLVNIIPGPIGMFRKEALKRVGYYDHDTFAEDCDVTLKLINEGYKIDFEAAAVAYTEAPEELLQLIKQRYRWTRGILQAIKKHRKFLWNLRANKSMSFVMWYMLFEAIFWPFAQIWSGMFMIYLAMTSGTSQLLILWWVIFTVLDIAGAVYCLLITKEKLSLAIYSVIYRLAFITVINIAKIFSTIEEWFAIEMSWGTLERKGRI